MVDRQIKIPGPDHPITIDANPSRVVVKVGGKTIADTREALTLREASYPPVQYIPRRDVDMAALTRSEHTTYCPYKGDASYYSIPSGGDRAINAVWTYETPFEAMARIKDYVAFYPDRGDQLIAGGPNRQAKCKDGILVIGRRQRAMRCLNCGRCARRLA